MEKGAITIIPSSSRFTNINMNKNLPTVRIKAPRYLHLLSQLSPLTQIPSSLPSEAKTTLNPLILRYL